MCTLDIRPDGGRGGVGSVLEVFSKKSHGGAPCLRNPIGETPLVNKYGKIDLRVTILTRSVAVFFDHSGLSSVKPLSLT